MPDNPPDAGPSTGPLPRTVEHVSADSSQKTTPHEPEETRPTRPVPVAAHSAAVAPAAAVAGYEILGELGRGGMGVVYRARDVKLNRVVALKMTLRTGSADRREVIRFLAEAEAVAAVRHQHVVQVYEYGEDAGVPFVVFEFLPGGTLGGRLKGAGQRDPAETAALVGKVAAGVAAAHALGIVHRDLKPANVLFDEKGEPKVTDFGLAKKGPGSELTETGAVMGTPAYMAPEQAGGGTKFVGPPADVWALGVILHEALAGERPFLADTTPELLARIQTADPEPLRGVPRDLDLIRRKCLEKNPADRYPTAKELADDLGRFARREPISIRPAGLLERTYKWARRKPTVAGLYAALAVATVAVGVGLLLADASARARAGEAEAVAESTRAVAESARADQESENAKKAHKERLTVSYYLLVQRAQEAWRDNNVLRAMQLLADEAVPAEYRDWEWRYVAKLCQSEVLRIRANGFVSGVAVSPDGRLWAGGVEDGTVQFWEADTGRPLLTYRGHSKAVKRVLFLPDGERAVSSSDDGEVHLWDVKTVKTLRTFKLPGPAGFALALGKDGRLAAGTHKGQIRVWNLETGETLASLTGHQVVVAGVLFAPDGRLHSVGGDVINGALRGTLRTWDLASQKEAARPRPHTGIVWGLVFSPDGKHLLTSDETGRVYTWDAETREPVSEFVAHDGRIWKVVFSPDGRQVLTASLDQTAKLWDAKDWKLLRTFRGHTNDVGGAAFLPGDRVLTHGDWTVRVWDATRDAEARVLTPPAPFKAVQFEGVAFDPEGRRVAAASQAGIFVWEAASGKPVGRFAGPRMNYRGVAFSPDGTAVAGGGERAAWVWPLDGRPPRELGGHAGVVLAVAFAPTGGRIASSDETGMLKVSDADSGRPLWSANLNGEVMALAFSPDGILLATGSEDKVIRLWDAATGRPVRELAGHTMRVSRVAFSADGKRLVSGSHDNTTRVWDVASGKQEFMKKGHTHYIDGVALSPDGKRLVDASGDRTVVLYDTRTREETLTLKGHADWVTGAVFSPDGSRIATCSRDGTVRIWDAPLGVEVVLPPESKESHKED
jgi:WD40 repeat protein/tRNA A-37 threonylcarbamoyl transferase component Bud32